MFLHIFFHIGSQNSDCTVKLYCRYHICQKEIQMRPQYARTLATITIAFLVSASSAVAQYQGGSHDWQRDRPSVEDKLARISETLDLNDEQSVEMLRILQEHEQQRAALHEQAMAFIGPEVCALKATHEADILAILNEDQAELFLQVKEQRKEKAAHKSKRRGAGGFECPE